MKTLSIALLFLIIIFINPLSLKAQSGRRTVKEPTAKPETSAPSTSNGVTVEGSDTRPNGEEVIEGDVVRVNTSLVTVPVTVADRYGKYVPDLRREDFHIYEEGVEQKIAYFAAVDKPITVVLVIDTSGSTHFRLEDIQDAAISFVQRLKDDDSVMVMSFDDRIRVLSRATSDREAVIQAIRRTHTGGGTRLYDTVEQILRDELATIDGRKAVVLFTDGVDTTSRHASFSGTLHDAEEADAPFYSVDYDTSGQMMTMGQGIPFPGRGGIIFGIPGTRGGGGMGTPGSSPADYRRANEYLHQIAETTGGRFYSADSRISMSQAFEWIAEELRRQYSLGYYPRNSGESGQRRQIRVRVNQPELVVRARDSYIYKKQDTDKQPFTSSVKSQ